MRAYYRRIKNGPFIGTGKTDGELPPSDNEFESVHWGTPPENLVSPGNDWKWNSEYQQFEFDFSMELERLKKDKIKIVNDNWTKYEMIFIFNEQVVTLNKEHVSDILTLNSYGSLPPNWCGYWKDVLNIRHIIPDIIAWNRFIDFMLFHKQDCFNRAQELKTKIESCVLKEQLDKIPEW
jgi:hypothetical protein